MKVHFRLKAAKTEYDHDTKELVIMGTEDPNGTVLVTIDGEPAPVPRYGKPFPVESIDEAYARATMTGLRDLIEHKPPVHEGCKADLPKLRDLIEPQPPKVSTTLNGVPMSHSLIIAWCPTCSKAINIEQGKAGDMFTCKRCGNEFRPSMYTKSPTNEPPPQAAPAFAHLMTGENPGKMRPFMDKATEDKAFQEALSMWVSACDVCKGQIAYKVKNGDTDPAYVQCKVCGKVHRTMDLYHKAANERR